MYCDHDTDREDLFQDILFQLWRSFPSFNHQSKFSSWMYRVALNTAISQFRKEKKRNEKVVDKFPVQLSDECLEDEKDERIRLLHMAISKLNKVEKSIIILYMDDYSYEEIAEITGLTLTNTGVKINRIKTKLQKIFKELEHGLQ